MEDWNAHINRLAEIVEQINLEKVTVLTGGNGKGKSVIRKLMISKCNRNNIQTWSCSMDKRAGLDSARGCMMVFDRDCEWLPTSMNTFHSVQNFYKATNSYGILDEIEIGMSEESQLGMAMYLNEHLHDYMEKNKGMLIITHSRLLARTITSDDFINIEGMSRDEWINREIIPTDFSVLEKESNDLFCALEKRIVRS